MCKKHAMKEEVARRGREREVDWNWRKSGAGGRPNIECDAAECACAVIQYINNTCVEHKGDTSHEHKPPISINI